MFALSVLPAIGGIGPLALSCLVTYLIIVAVIMIVNSGRKENKIRMRAALLPALLGGVAYVLYRFVLAG
jgi:hypothetical protein